MLFSYLTTLARYDLVYEVRDRARFLKGLLASAGLGKADVGRVGLAEEEFARGVEFEEQGEKPVQEEEERTLTGEMIKRVLFEGKETEVDSGKPRLSFLLPSSSPFGSRTFVPRLFTNSIFRRFDRRHKNRRTRDILSSSTNSKTCF